MIDQEFDIMNANSPQNGSQDFSKLYPLSDDYSCGLSEEQRGEVIEKYIAKALSSNEVDAFDEHTFYCETCFQALRFHEEMIEALAQEAESPATAASLEPSKLRPTWKFSLQDVLDGIVETMATRRYVPYVIAAAAVILLAIVVPNIFRRDNLEEQRRLFAANAQELPMYESLINDYQRSESITILSPENGFNCKNDILFRWQRDDASELTLIILNNQEEELFTVTTTANEYLFENAATRLQPGLYYWKLEDVDELKHVGKFFVKKPDE